MDWNDFAKRLTLELSRLPVKSFLIVQGPSGLPYTQAMRIEGGLDAEAVGSAFLPRPLAPRQERRLTTLGWEPPDGEERRNWWNRYTWRERGNRASSEMLEAAAMLAGQMVGAFRDVYGTESPLELVYQASRIGPEGGPLALPGLGIPLAVPESENPPAGQDAPRTAGPSGTDLETALVEARERGDQQSYLRLLARATLYLPASGDPTAEHRFATAQFGDGTFVLAFTSPEAMNRSLQGQAVHHREATLSELSRHWPHPDWQLAIDPGLPSASYLDAHALFEPVTEEPPARPVPPDPSDVRVAGRSSRPTSGRRRRSAAGRSQTAARSPQAAARPQPDSGTPAGIPAAAQAPSQPAADAPPPRPQPERPAPARRPEPVSARETPADPHGLPIPPPDGGVRQAPPHIQVPREQGPPQPARHTAPQPAPFDPPPAPGAPQPALGRRQAAPGGPPPAPGAPQPTLGRPQPEPGGPPPVPGGPQPAFGGPQPALDLPQPAPGGPQAIPGGPQGVPFDRHEVAERPSPHGAPPAPPAPAVDARSTARDIARLTEPEHRAAGVVEQAVAGSRFQAPPRAHEEPPVQGPPPQAPDVPQESDAAPLDGGALGTATEVLVMQKVLRREHVQHHLEGGYDLVAGYVHRLQDVAELNTPGALIRGLGLVYEGSPFSPGDEEIFVIRWPAVKPALFRRPLGGIDEWSMGIIPGGWVIEKAPFPGSGYAPGDGPAVPEFKIESQRLPHGAELYRLDARARESLVAVYDADLRRWLVRLPGGHG
ncbi:SseB family protein [Actinomadura opuntiae]|uniref:SseB family protein n=1 Tax=Actinomadura sp. OS1-43 TaxID=604315 RepID=UPI00255A7A3A|nr:SseB family protein [Actinomadura sp. OS1-43]MDL4815851.1 SseB family protein [Actinomadura sp. OS1-43]